MIDELDVLKRFRPEVAPPIPSARASARQALDRAIEAEQTAHSYHATTPVGSEASRRSRRRLRWVVATAMIGVALVAGVLVVARPSTSPGGARSAAGTPIANLRHAILTAFDSTAGDILSIHQTIAVSDVPATTEDLWISPAQLQAGQQGRTRRLMLGADGAAIQDVELIYTTPADLHHATAGGPRPTGEVIDVDYPTRTWSDQTDGSIALGLPDTPDAVAVGSLKAQVADGDAIELGRSTVDGQPVIELSLKGPHLATPLVLWVNSDTYLPVRESFTYGHETVTSDFTYLAPTSANLAQLQATIPPGFTETPSPPAQPGG